jgi:hypothetical protein
MAWTATHTGVAPEIPGQVEAARGKLVKVLKDQHSRPRAFTIDVGGEPREVVADEHTLIDPNWHGLTTGDEVAESTYDLAGAEHHRLRAADEPMHPVHDRRQLPTLLFLSASLMTLLTYIALRTRLPDLFLRSLLWLRRVRRHGLEVDGMDRLPASGPVLLATNATDLDGCLSVLSSTDRMTRFVLIAAAKDEPLGGLTRILAARESVAMPGMGRVNWDEAMQRAEAALARGEAVGAPLGGDLPVGWLDRLFEAAAAHGALVLPVGVERLWRGGRKRPTIYLNVGEPLEAGASAESTRRAVGKLHEAMLHEDYGKKSGAVFSAAH